jgi:hypothetical protein
MTKPWLYNGDEFTSEMIGDSYGFVYVITNSVDNKRYIGKKLFWSSKTKMVKKKKKRFKVESDWKEYFGSNKELQEDVVRHGSDNFTRDIVRLCRSKGECSYYEAKMQFDKDVLISDEYYNSWIMVKVHKNHLLTKK